MATEWSNKMLILRAIAGLAAAAAGAAIWFGMFKAIHNAWIPPLAIGALVGAAVRFSGGTPREKRPALLACVFTVLSGAAGYIWTDQVLVWMEQPSLGTSFQHLLNDFPSILLIAVGTYIAYMICRPQLPSK